MRIRTKEEIEEYVRSAVAFRGISEEAAREEIKPRHPLKEYTYAELKAEEEADPGWLVGDKDRPVLLAQALWMDFGPEKSGKTYRDLEIAMCVAFGFPYYGLPVQQGNIAYIITEGGVGRISTRLRALLWKYGAQFKAQGYRNYQQVIDAGKFNLIGSAVNLAAPDGRTGIKELLGQLRHSPYVAVWMDTWTRMLAESGGHSSDPEIVAGALRGCDYIRQQLGCTVDLIAHTPLSQDGRPKGMNEQTGNIDGATKCIKEGPPSEEEFHFTSEFQRHAKNGYQQVFKQAALGPDRVFVNLAGDFNYRNLKVGSRPRRMYDLLKGMPAGTTEAQWRSVAEANGLLAGKNPRQQFKEARDKLLSVGAVDIDGEIATAQTPKAEPVLRAGVLEGYATPDAATEFADASDE